MKCINKVDITNVVVTKVLVTNVVMLFVLLDYNIHCMQLTLSYKYLNADIYNIPLYTTKYERNKKGHHQHFGWSHPPVFKRPLDDQVAARQSVDQRDQFSARSSTGKRLLHGKGNSHAGRSKTVPMTEEEDSSLDPKEEEEEKVEEEEYTIKSNPDTIGSNYYSGIENTSNKNKVNNLENIFIDDIVNYAGSKNTTYATSMEKKFHSSDAFYARNNRTEDIGNDGKTAGVEEEINSIEKFDIRYSDVDRPSDERIDGYDGININSIGDKYNKYSDADRPSKENISEGDEKGEYAIFFSPDFLEVKSKDNSYAKATKEKNKRDSVLAIKNKFDNSDEIDDDDSYDTKSIFDTDYDRNKFVNNFESSSIEIFNPRDIRVDTYFTDEPPKDENKLNEDLSINYFDDVHNLRTVSFDVRRFGANSFRSDIFATGEINSRANSSKKNSTPPSATFDIDDLKPPGSFFYDEDDDDYSEVSKYYPQRRIDNGKDFDGDREEEEEWNVQKEDSNRYNEHSYEPGFYDEPKKRSDEPRFFDERKHSDEQGFFDEQKRSDEQRFFDEQKGSDEQGFFDKRKLSHEPGFFDEPDNKSGDLESSHRPNKKYSSSNGKLTADHFDSADLESSHRPNKKYSSSNGKLIADRFDSADLKSSHKKYSSSNGKLTADRFDSAVDDRNSAEKRSSRNGRSAAESRILFSGDDNRDLLEEEMSDDNGIELLSSLPVITERRNIGKEHNFISELFERSSYFQTPPPLFPPPPPPYNSVSERIYREALFDTLELTNMMQEFSDESGIDGDKPLDKSFKEINQCPFVKKKRASIVTPNNKTGRKFNKTSIEEDQCKRLKRGARGKQGEPGVSGPIGPRGETGQPGRDGRDGLRGTRGRQGIDGQIGLAGPPGEQGLRGANGVPGLIVFPNAALMYGVQLEGLIAYRSDLKQLYFRDHKTWRVIKSSRCGDGFVDGDSGEQCDDANEDPTDDCVQCRASYCGDGVKHASLEQCDKHDFGVYNCSNLLKGTIGPLLCSSECQIVTRRCRLPTRHRLEPNKRQQQRNQTRNRSPSFSSSYSGKGPPPSYSGKSQPPSSEKSSPFSSSEKRPVPSSFSSSERGPPVSSSFSSPSEKSPPFSFSPSEKGSPFPSSFSFSSYDKNVSVPTFDIPQENNDLGSSRVVGDGVKEKVSVDEVNRSLIETANNINLIPSTKMYNSVSGKNYNTHDYFNQYYDLQTISSTSRPIAKKPRPIANKTRQVTTKLHSIANKSHPISNKPHPFANNSHPTDNKPHPISNEPHLIANKPHSITNKPHLIANKPHQIANKPHPITNKPHLIANKTRPNINKRRRRPNIKKPSPVLFSSVKRKILLSRKKINRIEKKNSLINST